MRLHEYQAKQVLERYGIPVPPGQVATSVDEVHRIADRIGQRVVLKAQVLTGGRGQAGGILLANDAGEARRLAGQMLGMQVAGYPVAKVLVDQAIDIEQEVYLGIQIDRLSARPVIVASAQGGVEIAEVARDTPERVSRVPIEPLLGLRAYQVRALADEIGLGRERHDEFVSIALGLYRAFTDTDATLVEANPLVIRPDSTFCCLNNQIVVDDHALYRHLDLLDMRDESQDTLPERVACRHGITYVRLGGHVGCLSNGAGLAMATIDLLRTHGVRPANFVDIGKGATEEKAARGIELARNNSVHVVVVHVFCSLTPCDVIARGILRGCARLAPGFALTVCLLGPRQDEGQAMLHRAGQEGRCPPVYMAASLDELVDQVQALTRQVETGGAGG
ncbi:MAG TPA: ADP-forming succinate--CoA ligase subunit beta [Anaerolineae bacterium]|nr:ADP-forming succinate--CoA ligase subunit beta [Anaerolineae bacterium]